MVNIENFTKRLTKIMETHDLTASLFADKIGVQRSSISHILSGRNKPSLDFVLKVTHAFDDVDIHWLLNGKGEYPKQETIEKIEIPHSQPLFQDNTNNSSKKVKRVVVFYTDGTFEEYLKG